MARTIKAAAVQMNTEPSPLESRLERADALIAEAAAAGAQLVVLPEVFNTGYQYHDDNYRAAEPMNGRTVRWMKSQAKQHGVHLAGSLFLLDHDEVYNSQLLIAPDGRTWRYDKLYPWGWERAYFREGHGITVADTDLGNLGMMICWDYTHPEIWRRYAGLVDAMIITSCPPAVDRFDLVFDDGLRVNTTDIPHMRQLYTGDDVPFGRDMEEQAAWLGVPTINTTGSGAVRTKLPSPQISLTAVLASRPDLWERIPESNPTMETFVYEQTKIIDHNGRVLSRVDQSGDSFTLAEIELSDNPPQPTAPQPRPVMAPLSYLFSDYLNTAMLSAVYRQGYRRLYGARMAPVDRSTKVWTVVSAAAFVGGLLLGRLTRRDDNRIDVDELAQRFLGGAKDDR